MKKNYQVHNDLNRLKELSKKIQFYAEAELKLNKLCVAIEHSSASSKAKSRFNSCIKKVSLQKHLEEFNSLMLKYSALAKERLEPLERAIFIDTYINGATLKEIAEKTYYSESGIKKKLDKIIIKLAKDKE